MVLVSVADVDFAADRLKVGLKGFDVGFGERAGEAENFLVVLRVDGHMTDALVQE